MSPFLVRYLGRPGLGKWLIATQVVQYLGLVDFGVTAVLPRELSIAAGAANGQRSELRLLTGRTLRIILYQLPLLALLAVAACLWAKDRVPEAAGPIALLLGLMVLFFPLRLFPAILQGLQDLGFAGITSLIATVASAALTIVLILRGWGLYGMVLSWALTQLIVYLGAAWRVGRLHRDVMPALRTALDWAIARGLLGKAFWIAINQLLQVFIFGTDYLIIGGVMGAAIIVPFSFTGKLTAALNSYPNIMVMLAGPGLGELRGTGDKSRMLRAAVAIVQATILASGFIITVVLAVNSAFVTRWVGVENYSGYWVTLAQLSDMFARHLNGALACALLFFGYEKRLTLVGIADGVVTVGAAVFLTKLLGPMGSPLGSVVGVCLTSLPANVLSLSSDLATSRARMLRLLSPCLALVTVTGVGATFVGFIFSRGGYPVIIALGAVVSTVYCGLALLVSSRLILGEYIRPYLHSLGAKLKFVK